MQAEPHLFVVFGGTGDLMRRKLLPALYKLAQREALGASFKVLGVARNKEHTDQSYRSMAREALIASKVKTDGAAGTWCDQCLHYQSIGKGEAEDFQRLKERIEQLEKEAGLPGNRVFYLALGPSAFPATIEQLGGAGLNASAGWTRLVIEKPFGKDLASAHALNEVVHQHFEESQVYRIDHYLGKETVQNLLAFRFANPIFESLWNRDRVANVQITVGEQLGVGSRAGYYDTAGALRDMVQNHLTQLLTLTAMEAPVAFEADSVRDEKVKVLRSLKPLRAEDVVIGQYARTPRYDSGESWAGYLEEEGVAPDSKTATFVALRLELQNWRWEGVPFYLRTGKRLRRRTTQIVVQFKQPPVAFFQSYSKCELHSNALILTLQPDEGFDLRFDVKVPGSEMILQSQELHFGYADRFGSLPDGYETLLYDVLKNDQTLFVRADEVEAAWAIYEPFLDSDHPRYPYQVQTWGPQESNAMLQEKGHNWLVI